MIAYLYKWIDPSLNYGRHVVSSFLQKSRPYSSVLDIAAGTGADLGEARRLVPGVRALAFDCSPQFVAHLSEQGFEAHMLDIEHDPFPVATGEVDLVIANQTLEHTKEVFWIFHQISQAIPVGGRLIIGVPNLASLHNRILLAIGRQPTPIRTASAHVRGFTRADMVDFLDSCFPGGYRLVEYAGSNFYPFPAPVARFLAWVFPSLAWGAFFLFEKVREYKGEFVAFPETQCLETNFFLGADQPATR